MKKNLIIGIDSSTTATKAIAWTSDGKIAGRGRGAIELKSPQNNWYEQDPKNWWRSTCAALREMLQQASANDVAAVAISNQRETFVPLDERGEAVRPAIIWLDQRCEKEVAWLTERVGAERIHQITGKPPDMAPVAYRIAWMLRNEPQLFRHTKMFADVHAYLAWKLTGEFKTSWASADPMGLFDMEGKRWSEEVLKALNLSAEQLPQALAPGAVLGEVTGEAARECGLRAGTLVVAGGGDGQAAGLGVNALSAERAYLNLGTAVVSGTYSEEYRTGQAWRTMGSCTADGYYYETSLRAGAFLTDWFTREVCRGDDDIYKELEREASLVPIGCDGLLALPYWGAVMTPYWDPQARGAFVGFGAFHRRAHMYRALLEGIALEQRLVTSMIGESTGTKVKEFIAIGGGASSDLWCQILADATGKKVCRSETVEASSLGAAICAATGAGVFRDFDKAATAMSSEAERETLPNGPNCERYSEVFEAYRGLYPALRETFGKLSKFTLGKRS